MYFGGEHRNDPAQGARIQGHVLEVPNFGKVTIAEVFAVQGSRTVTMLHLELGSPQTANLTVAEAGTNGRPWPPPP